MLVICVEAGLRTVSELLLADPVPTNFRSALDKLYGEGRLGRSEDGRYVLDGAKK